MRRSLRTRGAGVSFFVFQDIITCVIGILLFISLFLALFAKMETVDGTATSDPATAADLTKLSGLIDASIRLKKEIAEAAEAAVPAEILKQKQAMLREELAALEKKRETIAGTNASIAPSDAVKTAITDLKKRIADMKAESDKLAAEAKEKKAEAAKLAAEVAVLEAQLLQAEKERSEIWLVPTPADTTKQPLIIIAAKDGFTLKTIGKGKAPETKQADDVATVLKGYDPVDSFAVVYFKPSTLVSFEKITAAVRSKGFDLGYDVISEDQEVKFQEENK